MENICFSSPVRPDQTQIPAILLFYLQWGFIPWRKTGQCVKLLTDIHSVLQLWISGVKLPPSHKPSWWEQGQMCYSNLWRLFQISINIVEESYCSAVHFCRITKIYHPTNAHIISYKLNSVALVRTRTIPTERPPPVGEVSANFCG